MSGHMPNVNESDPCEPPPPYSMVVGLDADAQGKTEAYRSPECKYGVNSELSLPQNVNAMCNNMWI